MGADRGVCQQAGHKTRKIILHGGTYTIGGLPLAHRVTVEGVGGEHTVIKGTVRIYCTEAELTGVTVTHGNSVGAVVGPGIAPRIADCTITANAAAGVVCEDDSSPSITGCTITANAGDGVYCSTGASPNLTGCTITGNTRGVYCHYRNAPKITSCTIKENSGDGLRFRLRGSPVITDCSIHRNAEDGVHCGGSSSPVITNRRITGNGASAVGVGFSTLSVSQCVIIGNFDGVSCREDVVATIINCTIAANAVNGVHCQRKSSVTVTDCIVWDNPEGSVVREGSGEVMIRYSCIEYPSVWPGTRNINADPLFCLPRRWDTNGTPHDPLDDILIEGDYRLHGDSPCLGTGSNGTNMGALLGSCGFPFQRGNANTDSQLDIADAVFTLSYLFAAGPALSCLDAADANDDGSVDIADPVYVLQHLFVNGPSPQEPFPECGMDPTVDDLDCAEYSACAQ